MPITLPPTTRRRFLSRSATAVGGALIGRGIASAAIEPQLPPFDPDRVALLADTHIDRDPKRVIDGTRWPGSPVKEGEHEGVNMAACLERVVRDILTCDPLPAHAIVNGDCARTSGHKEEYREFLRLIKPLRDVGMTVHVTIGNHDNRKQLWAEIPDLKAEAVGRHLGTVRLSNAELILLDSDRGTLGDAQQPWLREQLADDKSNGLPALSFIHYNPYARPGIRPSKGLIPADSASLLKLLSENNRAKACFFGHTHEWAVEQWIDVHMINQPAVGDHFGKGKAHGWLDMRLTDVGASLELRCVDPKHPQHRERRILRWR